MFAPDARPMLDIVTTLAGCAHFRTWTTILVRTLFIDDLRERGPWLVFAPSDEAFARLAAGTLERMFRPSRIDDLVDLAERHIVRSPFARDPELLTQKLACLTTGPAMVLARRACSNGVLVAVDSVTAQPRRGRVRSCENQTMDRA